MTQANKPFENYEKLLKAIEVAEILNISRAMAYELMRQGKIPTVHIGCARRVRPVDLQEFISRNLSQSLIGDLLSDEVR
jgi:excisionase family DNA binding protein